MIGSRSAAVQCALGATGMTAAGAVLLFLGVLAGGGLEVAYVGGAALGIGSLILYGTALWLRLTGAPPRDAVLLVEGDRTDRPARQAS